MSKFFRYLLVTLIIGLSFLGTVAPVNAQGTNLGINGCRTRCENDVGCVCLDAGCKVPRGATIAKNGTCGGPSELNADPNSTSTATDSVFGAIQAPTGVDQFTPTGGGIGLFNFISMMVRIFTVISGLVVFFNFIISGYTYIVSDGSTKSVEAVSNRLTYSVLGLVLIVSAYVVTALISLIFFGDASYILNPTITPPGVTPQVPVGPP